MSWWLGMTLTKHCAVLVCGEAATHWDRTKGGCCLVAMAMAMVIDEGD